jgi:hypothetical protein
MNTSNTLPESYQQRVYNTTLPTVKRQIQHAENPTPAAVICTEEARVDKAIILDYLTSEVAFEEPHIRSTDPNIPIDNNCTDDELHFEMCRGCEDCNDEDDEIDESNAIPTAIRRRQAATELERYYLGTSHVDGNEGNDGDDVDADEEDAASQADAGLMQTLDD